MEHQQITLGTVTYEIRRVFLGSRPVSELITDRLIRDLPDPRVIDDPPADAV